MLQQRIRRKGDRTVAQVLVAWSNSSPQEATWEDTDSLKQKFPRAPAWGASTSMDNANSAEKEGRFKGNTPGPAAQPTHEKRLPQWLASPNWAR